MKLFGIKFAPLNIPLERRLQTLSAFGMFAASMTFGTAGTLLMLYMLLYTNYWIIPLSYLSWIFIIDKQAPETGGRRRETFCNLKMFSYAKDYYPANLRFEKGFKLEASRNYLFAIYPHGVLSMGAMITLSTNAASVNELLPYHQMHWLTLHMHFNVPIMRDIMLLMGTCSASAKSINYLLGQPDGGKAVALVVGGAEECFYSRPGSYCIVLKNRKGFVKLALKNGSPLVPVFTFGEIEIYNQLKNPDGSVLRTAQNWIKKTTGFAPIVIYGRGFFQYTFGMVPNRRPLNVVVGKPIDVRKIENPTEDDVNILHLKYTDALKKIFDTYKHQYIKNSEHAVLEIR